MIIYLLNILFISIFGLFVISNYYGAPNNIHIENFDGYFSYVFIIMILYGIYKLIQYKINNKEVTFSPFSIFNYFLGHLFFLCLLLFDYNQKIISGGFLLFFKILVFLFVPSLIILISIGFGKKILTLLNDKISKNHTFTKLYENNIFNLIVSIGIGFFSFLFLLDTIGILGFYNLNIVFGILFIFLIFSYKEFANLIIGFFKTPIKFEIKKGFYLHLISTEFLFLVSSFVLSTSLINIIRPFPIGWDDLGVYMNHPHLLSEAGNIISLGGMYAWQTFTGIGYMLSGATQAFFFNVMGGIMSFITLVLITTDLLKTSNTKKTFINIPMLVGTIFISMPMIVFQQAKDMKLDASLFFVSIIGVYILFKYLFNIHAQNNILEKVTNKIFHHDNFDKGNIITIAIIGLIAGFAFSIKFTSLLLISSILGLFSYYRLGISGFLAYISIYFGIFTKLNLWKYMNVIVNPNKISGFENNFFIISLIFGIGLFSYSLLKNKDSFKKYLIEISVFLVGVIIALFPWIGNNIVNSYPNLSIGNILSGTSENFQIDNTKIYSTQELTEITKKIDSKKSNIIKKSKCPFGNEDYCRYLGYEKGINNYMKLPWNLTMQVNQKGEFTDIGFLYLLFIPLIFVFLPFKNKYYFIGFFVLLLFEILIFLNPIFKDLMASLTLPFGYLFIFLFLFIPVLYFEYSLKNTNKNYLFKINAIFTFFYVFLWVISSFGIVWYGIVMYFSFLLMIAFGLYYISNYESSIFKDYSYKFYGTIVIFGLILVYIFNSVLPHSFKNLKDASYFEYKNGEISMNESPFLYHPDYLNLLFELNIADNKKQEFVLNSLNDEILINVINKYESINNISNIFSILYQFGLEDGIDTSLKIKAKNALNNIYTGILNPKDNYKNNEIIYRIGTFLKYYISENNKRLAEDSLIFNFNNYIYNKDTSVTIDRFKKLGLKYLLVDLNAATIDKDPINHDLTDRYEKLLKTFVSEQLTLIETDSVCLKLALTDYYNYKDIDRFMLLAGVNYESYNDKNEVITRTSKSKACYEYILDLREKDLIKDNNFAYLNKINKTITENITLLNTKEKLIKFIHSQIGTSKKALFKIK